jgi:tetratricopeptide (TPR) repeat protein
MLAYLDLSRAYAILGQRSQALGAMQNALRLAPDHRYALRAAARLFVHIGEPDRALRLLVENARTPSDPWLLAPAIAIATIADKPPRFVRRAHELIERRGFGPQDLTEVHGAIGTLEYYAGRSAKARRAFRSSLISPTENVVAQARWARGRLAGIDIGEEAWNVPRSYEALCWRAVEDGAWSTATQYCSQWVQDEPFSSRPAILGSYIGISLVADPSFSEACARVGLQADSEDQTLLNNLTVALAYQGKVDDADATFRKITGELSEHYPKYIHLATAGLLEFRRGNVVAGRALYEEAQQRAPRERRSRVLIYWTREELQAGTERAAKMVSEATELTARDSDAQTIRLLEVFFGPSSP